MPDRRTSEQARAFAHHRALAKPHGFRVVADAEGFPIIPARYGQIEWTGTPELAVYTNHPRLFAKLWAIPGVRRHQTGDDEMRAMFPPEALEQGRPGNQDSSEAFPDARGGPEKGLQTHTQSDFRALEANRDGQRG